MNYTEERYYFLQECRRYLWSYYEKDEGQGWRQGSLGEEWWGRIAVEFEVIYKPFAVEILKLPYELTKIKHICFFFFFSQIIKIVSLSIISENL